MSDVMMKALQIQVESLTRQVESLGPENVRVRKLLTEFDQRHDADQARIRELDAEVAALRSAPEPAPVTVGEAWQPIETAPKDGLIDVWLKDGVRWADCYYDKICGEWRTSRPSGRLLRIREQHVSHWMPRPAPPRALADAGEAGE